MTNDANKAVIRTREILHEKFGGECWGHDCHESDMANLEFAHIFPTPVMGRGRGRKERIYDVSKNPGAYAYVCKYHHAELDVLRKMINAGRESLGLPPVFFNK